MQLYQLLDKGPTIPAGSYIVLQPTWEPYLCHYLVDYMGATEESDYRDDIPDPNEGTDRFWCTVDLNHPQCPDESLEDELVDYWNTGKRPVYVVAKH